MSDSAAAGTKGEEEEEEGRKKIFILVSAKKVPSRHLFSKTNRKENIPFLYKKVLIRAKKWQGKQGPIGQIGETSPHASRSLSRFFFSHESKGGELGYIGSSPTSLSHGPFFSTANFFSLPFSLDWANISLHFRLSSLSSPHFMGPGFLSSFDTHQKRGGKENLDLTSCVAA